MSRGAVDMATTHVEITKCDDGSFCCGNMSDALECCEKGEGTFVVDGKLAATNLTTISPSQSTPSVSPAPSNSSSSFPNPQRSKNRGTDIGGIVGAVVGSSTLIGGLLWFIIRKRKIQDDEAQREEKVNDPYSHGDAKSQDVNAFWKVEASGNPIAELNGTMGAELPGTPLKRILGELPA